jgi:hypothetical protein
MAETSQTQQELFFGEGFLEDHAGSIIREPRVAVIELIANAYDAGATEVKIEWPHETGGSFSITDNGSGMTKDEFDVRWKTLSYNRQESQGRFADNPNRISGEKRMVFGRSGKGRHGAFCFAKKGGFELTQKEVDQARDYAKELTKGGEVGPETEIVAYVLGAKLEPGLEPLTHGNRIQIIPFAYNTFLERAHSRTFQLQRRVEQAGHEFPKDAVIDEVLSQEDMELE